MADRVNINLQNALLCAESLSLPEHLDAVAAPAAGGRIVPGQESEGKARMRCRKRKK